MVQVKRTLLAEVVGKTLDAATAALDTGKYDGPGAGASHAVPPTSQALRTFRLVLLAQIMLAIERERGDDASAERIDAFAVIRGATMAELRVTMVGNMPADVRSHDRVRGLLDAIVEDRLLKQLLGLLPNPVRDRFRQDNLSEPTRQFLRAVLRMEEVLAAYLHPVPGRARSMLRSCRELDDFRGTFMSVDLIYGPIASEMTARAGNEAAELAGAHRGEDETQAVDRRAVSGGAARSPPPAPDPEGDGEGEPVELGTSAIELVADPGQTIGREGGLPAAIAKAATVAPRSVGEDGSDSDPERSAEGPPIHMLTQAQLDEASGRGQAPAGPSRARSAGVVSPRRPSAQQRQGTTPPAAAPARPPPQTMADRDGGRTRMVPELQDPGGNGGRGRGSPR